MHLQIACHTYLCEFGVKFILGLFSCFPEKYEYIGKLLKPGEQPTEYSDEEDAKDNKTKKDD